VPGCPPRPEALLDGIIALQDRIGAESLPERYRARREPIVIGGGHDHDHGAA
jgi:NADH-quinone oxidoreductase subunit B